MADLKISALTAATTPLAGTEVLPIVQSGATVKVAVSNLTAGRAISATSVTASTGNFVVGTSGQGIDFSATSHPAGMTSELLNDYEEGTFTATLTAFSTPPTTPVTATAYYTKIGRQVICQILFSNVNTTGASGAILIQGLPFTPTNIRTVGACNLGGLGVITGVALAFNGSTTMEIWDATQVNNISIIPGTGKSITATITYTA